MRVRREGRVAGDDGESLQQRGGERTAVSALTGEVSHR